MLQQVATTSFDDTLSASLGPCLCFTFLTHFPFQYVQGYVWVGWLALSPSDGSPQHKHPNLVSSLRIENYVSVCIAVGCWSPVVWYDAVFVATKHWQVTSVFMWGLFALRGFYYSSSMLKPMHIYFKLCVFTVSSDDTFF